MISPDDLLAEAQDLLAQSATKTRNRSAVSRAYYACFHHIALHPRGRDVVMGVDAANQKARAAGQAWQDRHLALPKALVQSSDKGLVFIAKDLALLLKQRVDADYMLDDAVTHNAADFALRRAIRLFDRLPP